MQTSVKERIAKLREEIAQISEANREYVRGGKKMPGAAADHERRLQRLQAILDELVALTDWENFELAQDLKFAFFVNFCSLRFIPPIPTPIAPAPQPSMSSAIPRSPGSTR